MTTCTPLSRTTTAETSNHFYGARMTPQEQPCTNHTTMEMFLDFWSLHGMPLLYEGLLGPSRLEFEVWKMIGREPPKIQPLGTLIKSQGTTTWVSKFFSQDPQSFNDVYL